jgi:Sulfotransferase domain
VVKVISQLILSLPDGPEYRIVFMQRPMAEVLKSQEEMLKRRGTHNPGGNTGIEQVFQRHLVEVDKWLAAKKNAKVLRVQYHRVLKEPLAVAEEVAAFLGVALDIKAMVEQVDASLYRNRMR